MDSQRADQLDSLYREAVALADRARAWFDGPGLAWRAGLPPATHAAVATESLATTARLMAAIAWLLDPAHKQPARQSPVFAFPAEADRASSALLADTPVMVFADDSCRLVARILALAPATQAQALDRAPDVAEAAVVAAAENANSPIFVATGGLWRA